jgi:hypothetical protein
MTVLTMLFAVACLVLSGGPAIAQKGRVLKPDQLRGEYVPPKNPAHQHTYNRLKERRVLERLSEFLSPFRLPRRLLMKVKGCDGEVDAFYQDYVITVCYEYLEYIRSNIPKEPVPGGLTPQDAVIGPTIDVFLHEAGHAVFDMLEIPVLGREEDAADLFSAYFQLQVGRQEARVLILGTAFPGQQEIQETMKKSLELRDYADDHGLPLSAISTFYAWLTGSIRSCSRTR